jgi:hypothetical protein
MISEQFNSKCFCIYGISGSRGPFSGSGGRPKLEGGFKPRVWRLAAKVVYPSGVEWAIKTFEP